MAIYDGNWISYANYVIATVESGGQFGLIERAVNRGIGVMQWSNWRSWELLNLAATDYPSETQTALPSLWARISGSNSWGDYIFSGQECQELAPFLISEAGKNTQTKLMTRDMENSYIPMLQGRGFTDPKTAIYALSVYHQSPNTAFNRIFNQLGAISNYTQWYNTALTDPTVGAQRGAGFANRQHRVKALLDEWDGTSGIEGWGGSDEWSAGTSDDDTISHDYDLSLVAKLGVIRAEKQDGDLILTIVNDGDVHRLQLYKASPDTWIPISRENDLVANQERDTPTTGDITGGDIDERHQTLYDLMTGLEGTLQYSQAQNRRTNIEGGYCDCSGLTWWLYQQIGMNIGSWTEGQLDDFGTVVLQGSGQIDINQLVVGDLILINWGSVSGRRVQHVEMYIGDDVNMGHGGSPFIGPTRKTTSNYGQQGVNWYIKRYLF